MEVSRCARETEDSAYLRAFPATAAFSLPTAPLPRRALRWRIKYGALKEDEAQRLKALEQENARLKRIVAEQALDISLLKDLERGKW